MKPPGAEPNAGARGNAAAAHRLKRLVRPIMMTLALACVVYAGWDVLRRWESGSVEIAFGPLALSVLPLLVGAFLQAWAWIVLIEHMANRKVPRGRAIALYLDSQLARYTPGKVGLPLVRMEGAGRIGVSARTVGSSVLIEMLSWTAVGGAVGFLLLVLFGIEQQGLLRLVGNWALPLFVLCCLTLLLLLSFDRKRLPLRVRSWLSLEGDGALLPLRLPLLHLLYWAGWAGHGYFASGAVGASATGAVSGAAFFVIAPVVGFLALAAPAGIGVRESVLYLGLVSAVGAGPAATAALMSRGASLVADLGTWAVSRPFRK